MTETTWDTEETSRIIANEEWTYKQAIRLARRAVSTGELANLLEEEFTGFIGTHPYSDVDLQNIDWEEIAGEYMDVDRS